MKKVILIMAMFAFTIGAFAQNKQDTVVIELAKTSRVIFTMRDKKDLEILKDYDFNKLFGDILKKLEKRDSSGVVSNDSTQREPNVAQSEDKEEDWSVDSDDEGDDDNHNEHHRRKFTTQSFNFDLGTNNFLSSGKFPDENNANYAVRPWGSWYVGMSSIQRTRVAKKVFVEWGLGISWYNFKFQNDNVQIVKSDDGVDFVLDTRDAEFRKSKLTATYITASLIPVIDFSNRSEKAKIWDSHGSAFRIGIGPYVGYRIGSHSKIVYTEDGHREKDKNRDNFYLNNFRYGARLQIGYRSTDLFFNYDLNELFATNKGPKLNAFSFGVIF